MAQSNGSALTRPLHQIVFKVVLSFLLHNKTLVIHIIEGFHEAYSTH